LTPFAFWEADFHKTKGREALSSSHKYLNKTDGKTGLTESFSSTTEFKIFGFEISFDFLNYFRPHLSNTM
jgi:hypothetical protein